MVINVKVLLEKGSIDKLYLPSEKINFIYSFGCRVVVFKYGKCSELFQS